jgi:hypothetical protein
MFTSLCYEVHFEGCLVSNAAIQGNVSALMGLRGNGPARQLNTRLQKWTLFLKNCNRKVYFIYDLCC